MNMVVKATTIKSGRKAASTRKVSARRVSIKVQKAEKPVAKVEVSPELETRIEGIAEPKINDDVALMDLKGVESNMMFQNMAVGEMSKSVGNVERELRMLTTLFKATFCVGAVGVVLVMGMVLRLTHYI